MPRGLRRAREYALFLLYQWDVTGDDIEVSADRLWVTHRAVPRVRAEAVALAAGVAARARDLDAVIGAHTEHWSVARMAAVDRALLRLATFELVYTPEVPAAIVISDAVDLAKKYGTTDSGAFVNGVLDAIRRDRAPAAAGGAG